MHCRYRLGNGALLHHLRTTIIRSNLIAFRGNSHLSGRRQILAGVWEIQSESVLHCTHSHSFVNGFGTGVRWKIRSFSIESDRICWWTNQRRGMALVSRTHREKKMSACRHLVANRNRWNYDFRIGKSLAYETNLRGISASRNSTCIAKQWGARNYRARHGRIFMYKISLARHAQNYLWRSRKVQNHLFLSLQRVLFYRWRC